MKKYKAWTPAIIYCSIVLIVMLMNWLTVDRTSIYTLTMTASITTIVPFGLLWGQKHQLSSVELVKNAIVTAAFTLILSLLLMVLL